MNTKKTLVLITAHQNRKHSTNYHNAQALTKSAKAQGYSVTTFEVFDFPPIVDHPFESPFPKEFDAPVSALLAADQIVFCTPMWNFGVPWALKNFLDGTIQAKKLFAFVPAPWWKRQLGIGHSVGYLKAQKAHIVWTCGGPATLMDLAGFNVVTKQIKLAMKFCGVKKIQTIAKGGIRKFEPTEYADWIQKLENYKF